MKLLTAKEARELGGEIEKKELNDVLEAIRGRATEGVEVLFVHGKLKQETIDGLISLGFEVSNCVGMSIQRGGIYFTITWD